MGNDEIKRMLGVGMATMSDRLQFYKDPFEPNSEEGMYVSTEMSSYVLLRHSGSEKQAMLGSESPGCKQKDSDAR